MSCSLCCVGEVDCTEGSAWMQEDVHHIISPLPAPASKSISTKSQVLHILQELKSYFLFCDSTFHAVHSRLNN